MRVAQHLLGVLRHAGAPGAPPALLGSCARAPPALAARRAPPAWRAASERPRMAATAAGSKAKPYFQCTNCGARHVQWKGLCPGCKTFNTVEEVVPVPEPKDLGAGEQAARRALAAAVATVDAPPPAQPPPPLPAARPVPHAPPEWGVGGGTSQEADSPDFEALALEAESWDDSPLFPDAVPSPSPAGAAAALEAAAPPPPSSGWVLTGADAPERLGDIRRDAAALRIPLPSATGAEVSLVLGGGLVPGSLVLIGGDPGVGKSTLLLQVAALVARAAAPAPAAAALLERDEEGEEEEEGSEDLPLSQRMGKHGPADAAAAAAAAEAAAQAAQTAQAVAHAAAVANLFRGRPVLYVTAEESKDQVWQRARRMGLVSPGLDLLLVSENRLDVVLGHIRRLRPLAVVIDSIQTVVLGDVDGRPGSLQQVRECATALLRMARSPLNCAVLMIGHVTKDGSLAGPKQLEHLTDVVLYLEGEQAASYRMLRAVKNRHGRVGEVGLFAMKQAGLEVVSSPWDLFTSSAGAGGGVGAAIGVVQEGVRPLMLEVQALVGDPPVRPPAADGGPPASFLALGPPLRSAVGFASRDRLHMLLEVMNKHTRVRLPAGAAIFVNVVGGFKVAAAETSMDAAVLAAVASSALEARVPSKVAVIAEVGLAGELRAVKDLELRLYEAAKLKFEWALVPAANKCDLTPRDLGGLRLVACHTLGEALESLFGPSPIAEFAGARGPTAALRRRSSSRRGSRAPSPAAASGGEEGGQAAAAAPRASGLAAGAAPPRGRPGAIRAGSGAQVEEVWGGWGESEEEEGEGEEGWRGGGGGVRSLR